MQDSESNKKVNKWLKVIAERMEIEAGIPTRDARHSFATVFKKSGENIALISETLGHAALKTTQIYLDSIKNSQIDRAIKNLL